MEVLNEFFKFLRVKLLADDPYVVYCIIVLIDVLVKNCGTRIHVLLNRKRFMKTLSLVTRRFVNKAAKTNSSGELTMDERVANLSVDCIQVWGEGFKSRRELYPHIVKTYSKMKSAHHIRFLRTTEEEYAQVESAIFPSTLTVTEPEESERLFALQYQDSDDDDDDSNDGEGAKPGVRKHIEGGFANNSSDSSNNNTSDTRSTSRSSSCRPSRTSSVSSAVEALLSASIATTATTTSFYSATASSSGFYSVNNTATTALTSDSMSAPWQKEHKNDDSNDTGKGRPLDHRAVCQLTDTQCAVSGDEKPLREAFLASEAHHNVGCGGFRPSDIRSLTSHHSSDDDDDDDDGENEEKSDVRTVTRIGKGGDGDGDDERICFNDGDDGQIDSLEGFVWSRGESDGDSGGDGDGVIGRLDTELAATGVSRSPAPPLSHRSSGDHSLSLMEEGSNTVQAERQSSVDTVVGPWLAVANDVVAARISSEDDRGDVRITEEEVGSYAVQADRPSAFSPSLASSVDAQVAAAESDVERDPSSPTQDQDQLLLEWLALNGPKGGSDDSADDGGYQLWEPDHLPLVVGDASVCRLHGQIVTKYVVVADADAASACPPLVECHCEVDSEQPLSPLLLPPDITTTNDEVVGGVRAITTSTVDSDCLQPLEEAEEIGAVAGSVASTALLMQQSCHGHEFASVEPPSPPPPSRQTQDPASSLKPLGAAVADADIAVSNSSSSTNSHNSHHSRSEYRSDEDTTGEEGGDDGQRSDGGRGCEDSVPSSDGGGVAEDTVSTLTCSAIITTTAAATASASTAVPNTVALGMTAEASVEATDKPPLIVNTAALHSTSPAAGEGPLLTTSPAVYSPPVTTATAVATAHRRPRSLSSPILAVREAAAQDTYTELSPTPSLPVADGSNHSSRAQSRSDLSRVAYALRKSQVSVDHSVEIRHYGNHRVVVKKSKEQQQQSPFKPKEEMTGHK